MLTRLDKLTFDFILAVIITDCLVGFFVWYEVIYNVGDSRVATAVGIGAGIAISLAVTVVVFAHWELVRMISERYKRLQYEEGRKEGLEEGKKMGREAGRQEGRQEGRKEGREEGRKEERERLAEFLHQTGIELSQEDKQRLFGEGEQPDS